MTAPDRTESAPTVARAPAPIPARPALEAPPLDHAAMGNGRILALVSPTSAIEWLRLPRFDSPSVFGRLLDRERGGTWRVLHHGREIKGEMSYLPNTNIAVSRFTVPGAVWEVVDFAPAPVRPLSQAPRLGRHRRDHRGRHHQHPGLDGQRADLGLPLLLAPRRGLRGRGAPPVEPADRGGALPPLPPRRGRERAAPTGLRDRGRAESRGADAAPPGRVRRQRVRPDGERGRPPDPERPDGRDRALPRDLPHRPALVHDNVGDYLPLLERLVEEAIRVAPERDTGIWEYRSILKHSTFSKAMCWVAMHRGAELARGLGAPRLADRWERQAVEVRRQVLERGFNPALGYFTASLDGEHPDSAILLLPTLGLIDPKDPRMIATVDAYRDLLTVNGLFLRYRTPDDFGETTSAFTICSFWYAEALALMGRLEEAIEVFQRVLRFANPVGLFSEDIDPASGRLLGNFPQAYTHVGPIHAATTIGELVGARDGRVRAWS